MFFTFNPRFPAASHLLRTHTLEIEILIDIKSHSDKKDMVMVIKKNALQWFEVFNANGMGKAYIIVYYSSAV